MPLAGSRSSVNKASKMRRDSLPKTISSSTRATKSKALKRRASSSTAGTIRRSSRRTATTTNNKTETKQEDEEEDIMKEANIRGRGTRRGRSADKENDDGNNNKKIRSESPGPTPYWKVLNDRGGETSPRETRSASAKKKKKGSRLPPSFFENNNINESNNGNKSNNSDGIVLTFSPPNQELNRIREEEEKQRKIREHSSRVATARSNGQLLLFSPTNNNSSAMNYKFSNDNDNIQHKEEDEEETKSLSSSTSSSNNKSHKLDPPTSKDKDEQQGVSPLTDEGGASVKDSSSIVSALASTTGTAFVENETVLNEITNLKETIQKSQADKISLESSIVKCTLLEQSNNKLEKQCEQLQVVNKELEQTIVSNKETYLRDNLKLQGELDATKREYTVKIEELLSSKGQLQEQIRANEIEKMSSIQRMTELQEQINNNNETMQCLRNEINDAGSKEDVEVSLALREEINKLQRANNALSEEIEQLSNANKALEGEITNYKKDLDMLQNQLLPESESQLQQVQLQLKEMEGIAAKSKEEIEELNDALDEVTQERDALNKQVEEERQAFEASQSNDSEAYDKLKSDDIAKRKKIDLLNKELNNIKNELKKEKQLKLKQSDESTNTKQALEKQIIDLQRKLQSSDEELKAVKNKMAIEKQSSEEATNQSNNTKSMLEKKIAELQSKLQASEEQTNRLEDELSLATMQIKQLSSDKEKALVECSNKAESIEQLQSNTNEDKQQISNLQDDIRNKQLVITNLTHERDDIKQRIETFDVRENELFFKLRESDRVRRSLHNRVMQLSGNIRVYVRVRPVLSWEIEQQHQQASSSKSKALVARDNDSNRKRKHGETQSNEDPFHFPGMYDRENSSSEDDLSKSLLVMTEPYKDRGGLNPRRKQWKFGFDNVFAPNQGQDDIWEATEPLVQSAIDGYNVCIFAYGQTGSGKTYTMLGGERADGIITRSVNKLFETKREIEALSRGETQISLSVELLEIYNEKVRDLLDPNAGPNGREINLKVSSNEAVGNIVVSASNQDEVMNILQLAQTRRCVKATQSNAESSRSHMLFTIHFHVQNTKENVNRSGKLHVCDLAGSERLSKSGANSNGGGSLLTETKHINKSLSVLSNVIESLQTGSSHVPYRDSKLTYLLQNSLGGNSKTLAIVCCNPLSSHFHESLCSLRFASKVNKVDLKAVANFSC